MPKVVVEMEEAGAGKVMTSEGSPLVPGQKKRETDEQATEPEETTSEADVTADIRRKAVWRKGSPDPQLKAKAEGPGGFYGYLAVWGNVDLGGEVMVKGCFAKSLADEPDRKWPLMVRHVAYGGDVTEMVGYFTAKEDDFGLAIDATYLQTDLAQETRAKTDQELARGLSVGYREITVTEGKEDGELVRYIEEAALLEGTVTLIPMNEKAVITAVKSLTSSDALEVIRAASHDGLAGKHLDLDRERAKALLGELEEAHELLSRYLAPAPSEQAADRSHADGLSGARRKRLALTAARARARNIL